jgi:hypothetical protein
VPLYVQLGAETFVGAGHYMMEPDQLCAIRAAVLDGTDGRGARDDRRRARADEVPGRLPSTSSRRCPAAWIPSHPRAELLKRKSLAVEFPPLPKRLIVSACVRRLARRAASSAQRPLVEWLAEETA